MAKIPFSIEHREKIESGEYKVEIGKDDPWPARIVCWDLNGNDLIVIISNPGGREEGLIYTSDGRHKAYSPNVDSNLFIVTPEEGLTEWEKEVKHFSDACARRPNYVPSDGDIRNWAAELLVIARKELENETPSIIHAQSFNAGLKRGKAEALKDLPRWVNIRNFAYSWTSEDKTLYDNTLGQLFHKGKKLFIGDLEKLPGFNED